MEDLLREDDFLIKGSYNPSKYFRMFYFGAVIHFIMAAIVIGLFTGNISIILLMIFSPLFMLFGMVFFNKRIAELAIRTILTSIGVLLGIYYILMLLVTLIANAALDEILIMTLIFAVCFIVCSAIIVPIIKMKKKKNKISY